MSDLYDYVKSTGIIVPDTSDILSDVRKEWKDVFGSDLSLEEGTPQGRIIELLTKERKNSLGSLAYIANQINPDFASGTFLDSIGLLFGVLRKGKTKTLVQNVNLYGIPSTTATGTITLESNNLVDGDFIKIGFQNYVFGSGDGEVAIGANRNATAVNLATAINTNTNTTVSAIAEGHKITLTAVSVQPYKNTDALSATTQNDKVISFSGDMLDGGTVIIPDGVQVEDTNGNKYAISGDVMLDNNGTALGNFFAVEYGAIACPKGTLTNCTVEPIEGWESMNNGDAGIIGFDEESDSSYRISINRQRSKYASSYLSSLYSSLYELDGTKSVYIYENPTGFTKTNTQDSLIPVGESIDGHSIFIVISGDTGNVNYLNQVAKAIVEKRSGGCGMVASSVYPANVKEIDVQNGLGIYKMTFNVAQPVKVSVNIIVKNISYTGENLAQDVQNVITDWFSGNINTGNRNEIGYDVSSFDIASTVSRQLGVYVKTCEIKKTDSSDPFSTVEIPIEINEIASVGDLNVGVL